jgi:hypothetical protein
MHELGADLERSPPEDSSFVQMGRPIDRAPRDVSPYLVVT